MYTNQTSYNIEMKGSRNLGKLVPSVRTKDHVFWHGLDVTVSTRAEDPPSVQTWLRPQLGSTRGETFISNLQPEDPANEVAELGDTQAVRSNADVLSAVTAADSQKTSVDPITLG